MAILDERIRQELLNLYQKRLADGKLHVGADLQRFYDTFRNKFGPDKLQELDGDKLLFTMKGGKDDNSLIYWLDFKRDDEFPNIFGNIAGGGAHKHGVFRKLDTGKWISGPASADKEVTQEQALEIAKEHRRQIIEGCKLLESLPLESDEDYAVLQREMNRAAPFVSDTAWGHKYFSLLYPDKLDDFHVFSYQYFHLLKLLQVPPEGLGFYLPGRHKAGVRYLAAGRFIRMARSLDMAVNTLTTLLNERNGAPYRYWRIGTTSRSEGKSYWEEMHEMSCCAIGWSGVGNLSTLPINNERKNKLRELVAERYPNDNAGTITKAVNQLSDFVFTIAKGDLVLVSEGAKVLGIGQVTGDYFYDATKGFAHCRSVQWLSLEQWSQPDQNPGIEGKLTTLYEMKRPLNLLEAERKIFRNRDYSPKSVGRGDLGTDGKIPPAGGVSGPDDDVEPQPPIESFVDSKLASIPEARLKQQIATLRRLILVDEKVVRRIYYALLNGHVILAGPPGTGKTELAKLIPEILWQNELPEQIERADGIDQATSAKSAIPSGYTTSLVTATSEWSTHTLISSIVPAIHGERVIYRTRYGYLTEAILRNWVMIEQTTTQWEIADRRSILVHADDEQQIERKYRGHWLIIDEFNRAPIDAALGEAMTALSNGEALHVPVDGTRVLLPLPQDFRIIGTLNSFDRNYLNKISEALKRRFSFIEVLPPTRRYRQAEQGIVLYKALRGLEHHSSTITASGREATWENVVALRSNDEGVYEIHWLSEQHPFYHVFTSQLWPLFETIRVYRQLGTAQVIALTRQLLTQGLLQNDLSDSAWHEMLDIAFCDTIADQLQVLLADELDVLSWSLKLEAEQFIDKYNGVIADLRGKKRRLTVHLEALSTVVNEQGEHILPDEEVEFLLEEEDPQILPEVLREAFRLECAPYRLPQFARRLRNFKAVHGL